MNFFMMNEFKQKIFKALNREAIGDCIDKENGWVKKSFYKSVNFQSFFSTKLKAVLIELSTERSLTVILYYRLLYDFWHIIWKEFKELNDISITKVPSILILVFTRIILSPDWYIKIKTNHKIYVEYYFIKTIEIFSH